MSKLILSKLARLTPTATSLNLKKLEHFTTTFPNSCSGPHCNLEGRRCICTTTTTKMSSGSTGGSGSGSGSDDRKKALEERYTSFFDSMTVEGKKKQASRKSKEEEMSILFNTLPNTEVEMKVEAKESEEARTGATTAIGIIPQTWEGEGRILDPEVKLEDQDGIKESSALPFPHFPFEVKEQGTIFGKMSPEGKILELEVRKRKGQKSKGKPVTPGSMAVSSTKATTPPPPKKDDVEVKWKDSDKSVQEACSQLESHIPPKRPEPKRHAAYSPNPKEEELLKELSSPPKPETKAASSSPKPKIPEAKAASPPPKSKIPEAKAAPPPPKPEAKAASPPPKPKIREAKAAPPPPKPEAKATPPATKPKTTEAKVSPFSTPAPEVKEDRTMSSVLREAHADAEALTKILSKASTQTASKKSSRKRDKYKLEALAPDDCHRRLMFATKLLLIIEDEPEILDNILWTDECNFNLPKLNPGLIRKPAVAESELLPQIAWCGITTRGAVGPYFFNSHVTDKTYLKMLEKFLIPELECKGYNLNQLWFQQDGAPWHRSKLVLDFLKSVFDYRIISLGTKFIWPPRSQDLTPMDYFFWDYMKLKINFKHSKYDLQFQHGFRDILAKEVVTASRKALEGAIYQIPERLEMCLNCNGGRFQHLLYPGEEKDEATKVKEKIPTHAETKSTIVNKSAVPPSRFMVSTPAPPPPPSAEVKSTPNPPDPEPTTQSPQPQPRRWKKPKDREAKVVSKPTAPAPPPRPELNPSLPKPRPVPRPTPVGGQPQPSKPKPTPIQVQRTAEPQKSSPFAPPSSKSEESTPPFNQTLRASTTAKPPPAQTASRRQTASTTPPNPPKATPQPRPAAATATAQATPKPKPPSSSPKVQPITSTERPPSSSAPKRQTTPSTSAPPPIEIPNQMNLSKSGGIGPVTAGIIKFPEPQFPQPDLKSCVNSTIADTATSGNVSEDLFNHNYEELFKNTESEKEAD